MDNIIPDGSLIAYEPVSDAYKLHNGDIVVYSNDYEYSVKHYYKHNDTLVFKPNSTNPIHHDQTYNIDDNITIHGKVVLRSEEHTSELQSRGHLVCRLLLEKKN